MLSERNRALDLEYVAIAVPHRARIRELMRLVAIEERHIEKKQRAVVMKGDGITFIVPPRAPSPERPE